MRTSGRIVESNIIEVRDRYIVIRHLKPGLYKIKYLEEELMIEITEDRKIIIYEILTEDNVKRMFERTIEKQE